MSAGGRPRALGLVAAIGGGCLSGLLHAAALGAWPRPLLAWAALIPLLYVTARVSRAGVVVGALAYTGTLLAVDVAPWFLATLGRYFRLSPAVAVTAGVAAVTATVLVYGLLLGGALAWRRRTGALGVVWCAALWAVWEPLRTALLPPYFPLAVLATSQADVLPVLQVASVTAFPGVTALLVLVNAALAQLGDGALPARRKLATAAVAVGLAVAVTGWGAARVRRTRPSGAAAARVLVVDGAAADVEESTLDRYIAATGTPGDGAVDLVVWPESAVAVDFEASPEAWKRMRAFVDALGAPVLTGGVGSALGDHGDVLQFNAVHFIRPRHGMLSYHKRLLVPFAESWPAFLGAPPVDPVAAGDAIAVFGDGDGRFGPLICFEITYPAAVRALAARGARFVVNVNNDVWFAGWTAPQAVWARIRAVESGLPVVRATNGGTSAIIDPLGRVVASSRSDGRPMLLTATVPAPVDTIYAATGDVFVVGAAVFVAVGLLRRRRVTASASV